MDQFLYLDLKDFYAFPILIFLSFLCEISCFVEVTYIFLAGLSNSIILCIAYYLRKIMSDTLIYNKSQQGPEIHSIVFGK